MELVVIETSPFLIFDESNQWHGALTSFVWLHDRDFETHNLKDLLIGGKILKRY